MHKDIVKRLESNEQYIDNKEQNCDRCAYKERTVNYCWYTMTTHKQNFKDKEHPNGCKHFVDLEKFQDDK